MASRVVYEDDHIQVLHQPGSKPYALATFAPVQMQPNGHRFKLRAFCTEEKIETFGFVAKQISMYPDESVHRAIECGAIRTARPLVAYGASAGSSPALHFAAALGAAGVIASAPIFGLDPEIIPKDRRFAHYYRPVHKGRKIASAGMAGKIALVFDPHDPREAYHAELIRASYQGNSLYSIPVHFLGHMAFPDQHERETLLAVIEFVLTDQDERQVFGAVRAAKKRRQEFACGLGRRLVQSGKPGIALDVLDRVKRNSTVAPDASTLRLRALVVADAYVAMGETAVAVAEIEDMVKLWPRDIFLLEKLATCLAADHQVERSIACWKDLARMAPNDAALQRRCRAALERAESSRLAIAAAASASALAAIPALQLPLAS